MDYKTHNSVGILGDEDTINGFMISGIQLDTKNPNLIQVTYNKRRNVKVVIKFKFLINLFFKKQFFKKIIYQKLSVLYISV